MSESIQAIAGQFCFVRTPKVNGESSGWRPVGELRCLNVALLAGPRPGHATFDIVKTDLTAAAMEDVLAAYPPDTQVRVVIYPYDSAAGIDGGTDAQGVIVFEGVLNRTETEANNNPDGDEEGARLHAAALPWIDAGSKQHLITGRWVWSPPADEESPGTWDVIESPLVPVTFNYRGRGNMDADDAHKQTSSGLSGGELTARPFTHDDDPAGQPWTLREAIKSLLVMWLYGYDEENPLDRVTGVELDLLNELEYGSASPTGHYEGLDDVLPEVTVDPQAFDDGADVISAIAQVCGVAGYEMAVVLNMLLKDSDLDRRWELRLWRRHAGPQTDLYLPKRGRFPASAGATLKVADVHRVSVLRDTAGIVNEVIGRGRVAVEVTVPLKPLWHPDDIEAPKTGSTFDAAPASNAMPNPHSDTYHAKHVQGGEDFGDYAYVGRAWGIDCTGASAEDFYPAGAGEDPYAPGEYAHDPEGFDWLDYLGIDGTDAMSQERVSVGKLTDPIYWQRNRLRLAHPLTRLYAQLLGRRFVLEVTEDATAETPAWTDITNRMGFTTLDEFFGVLLTGVPNLAAVNAATLGTDLVPAIEDSWWQKMLDEDLGFRLTCNVPADHASAYYAGRQISSGTGYSRFALLTLDAEEVWAQAGNFFNASGALTKLPGTPGTHGFGGDLVAQVKSAAVRHRDAYEGTRWACSAGAFLLRPWAWRIGDSVRGIRGRNIGFATGGGSSLRFPEIVGVHMTLAGGPDGNAQSLQILLNDTAIREGV